MNVLNRTVVILRPTLPYAAWANDVDQEAPQYVLDVPRTEGTAYLLPAINYESATPRILRRYDQSMCEHELAAWMQDEACWPVRRDGKTFQAWCDVEWRSIVIDLSPTILEGEEI